MVDSAITEGLTSVSIRAKTASAILAIHKIDYGMKPVKYIIEKFKIYRGGTVVKRLLKKVPVTLR